MPWERALVNGRRRGDVGPDTPCAKRRMPPGNLLLWNDPENDPADDGDDEDGAAGVLAPA